MITRTIVKLVALDEGKLPSEFRLFVPGWNDTEKGRFLFDAKAAKSVMAAWQAWGVDLAIDLEHQSLTAPDGAPDPTARDARGWCKLAVRGGELWAVNVTWTNDGAERLLQKRQRYVSPAFESDRKTGRILKMINIAIVAMPATHKTPALVAASMKGRTAMMDLEMVKKALEAIADGDDAAAQEILKEMIAAAASGDSESPSDEPGAEGDGAEGVHEESVTDPKVVEESEAEAEDDEDDEDEEDGEDKKKVAAKAMLAMLRRVTGESTLAGALLRVGEFKRSHVALETERQTLAAERATLERTERRQLVADLVKLGSEFPSTVWADDKAKTIKPRWAQMPIVELRAHVAEQRQARAVKKPATGVKPPPGDADGAVNELGLSDEELTICKDMKCDPKDFAALKAQRDGKKGK